MNKIPIEIMCKFTKEMKAIRSMFPELAREIDRCVFDASDHLGKCGHATCDCQMTFEQFHRARNVAFGTFSGKDEFDCEFN